jgi:hypothetical protein
LLKRRLRFVRYFFGVGVVVPRAILFEIEVHFLGDLRDYFLSERIGALECEVCFIRRRASPS